jgi:hypothetical protein
MSFPFGKELSINSFGVPKFQSSVRILKELEMFKYQKEEFNKTYSRIRLPNRNIPLWELRPNEGAAT